MNEIREICTSMLDGPVPPMRSPDEVLAVARRDRRRQRWFAASGAFAAVVALMAVVIGALGPSLLGRDRSSPHVGSSEQRAPAARAAASHGRTMADVLVAALPKRYAHAQPETFSDDPVVRPTAAGSSGPRLVAVARVLVSFGPGSGQLVAYLVHNGQPVPDGDLCVAQPAHLSIGTTTCEVRTVDGVPVRVVTTQDERLAQAIEATRFLDGGSLTVAAWQSVPYDPTAYRSGAVGGTSAWPPLDEPPLDGVTVAELAADRRMLPPA